MLSLLFLHAAAINNHRLFIKKRKSLNYIVQTAELMKSSIQTSVVTRRKGLTQMALLNCKRTITGDGMLEEQYMHYKKKNIVFLRSESLLCFGVHNSFLKNPVKKSPPNSILDFTMYSIAFIEWLVCFKPINYRSSSAL